MGPSKPDPRLVAALEKLVDEDVALLLAEARIEARERVRGILVDALAEAMLDRARGAEARPGRATQATPQATRNTSREPEPQQPERRTRKREAAKSSEPTGERGLYVYCVVPAGTSIPDRLDGISAGHSPALLEHDELAAVVSSVPLEDFGEERLREHLADMEWIEHAARTHERVLEAIADHATLIPMRLCSVYRDERGVTEMLMRESAALTEALHHLEGKTEWGLKVFAVTSDKSADDAYGASPAESGTDYMRQRQSERQARADAGQRQHDACLDIHEQLARIVADAQTLPVQRPEVSGHPGEMVLNGVYLVEDDQRDAFLALVEELQDDHGPAGLELQPTGPWPAYNFVPGTIGAAW